MSIFVSWRGSDRDLKNELVAELRRSLPDETVWESDEGCNSNAYEEFISEIRKSEIFVVIVSDETMKPSYVFNEIIEARACEMAGRLNMLVYKTTDAPYTKGFAANLNHLSDANHVARLKGETGYETLAKRIKVLLEKRRNGEPENPYDTFNPEIKGTELSHGYYVPESRDDVFEEFDKAFEKSNIIIAAQMNGYGKKCAVREYLLNKKDIRKKIILHSFSGSMRQFFLKGIEITNISNEVFKNMDETEAILAKARLLSRLDKSTAVIVPEYIPGEKDDRFIFDALSSVGCRVIFIAQSVPPLLKNVFPVVSVGRMKDEHLKELFFNYYEASPEEQEELTEPLYEFFEGIDGHTKSVEVTANYLAQEFGIYPDEVAAMLKNIHPNSEDELAERVFELISELFDMTDFSDTEKDILLTAAYFANTAIDEKFFTELLQNAEIYDAKTLRSLIERGWIECDRTGRTFKIDSFFANVCRGKTEINEKLLARHVEKLSDHFFTEAASMSVGSMFSTLNRFGKLFSLLGFDVLEKACRQANTSEDENTVYFTDTLKVREQKKLVFAMIKDRFTDEELIRNLTELADCIFSILTSQLSLHTRGEQRAGSTMAKRLIYQSMGGIRTFTDMMYENLDNVDNSALKACMEGLILAANTADITAFITAYEASVKIMCRGNDEEATVPLYLLGEHIITCIRSASYLTLRVCRAWMQLNNAFGVYSYARAFNILSIYIAILDNLKIYDDEFDNVFNMALEVIGNAKKEGYFLKEESQNSNSSASEAKAQIYSLYVNGLIARGDTDEAAEALYSLKDVKPLTPKVLRNILLSTASLMRELIRMGETENALKITKDVISSLPGLSKEELSEDGADALTEIELFREAIEAGNTQSGFNDSYLEYTDYYRRFATEYTNKKLYRKYEEIAKRATKKDYSSLEREELLNIAEALKKRALSGETMESLAPDAFALISEAGYRVLGYRHHFVQYLGAIAIADGNIAEIQNGEGKTYTIIASAFLHYLYGKHIYITDSSHILTQRNYLWMRGVLNYLGCNVGLIRRGNGVSGKNYTSFDIIYTQSSDLVFEYMQDELNRSPMLAPLDVVIADEAEQLLVAEGHIPHRLNTRTAVKENAPIANAVYRVLASVTNEDKNRYFSREQKNIIIKEPLFNLLYLECEKENIAVTEAQAESLLKMGADALFFCEKDKDYFVVNGTVKRENKAKGCFENFTDIFSFFLCRKEHLPFNESILKEHKAANAYIFTEFARNIKLLCGTTATASSMKTELFEIYGLAVVPIPTNIPIRRVDYPPVLFTDTNAKFQHIAELIAEKHETGQPILIITESVYDSAVLSKMLRKNNILHKLLNAQNSDTPADILEEAGLWGAVTVATAVANRGVDIRLGGNPKTLAKTHLLAAGYTQSDIDNADLQGSNISEKLQALTAYYRTKTEPEREKINALGGLCVIGTSCFTDLRTEQQMRGRCGRQGDKGESHVFFSLDDEGFKHLLGNKYQSVRALLAGQGENYANLGSVGYLVKMLSSAREKYQNMQYTSLLNAPEILYRVTAREAVLGLARSLWDGKCNIEALAEEYFYNAPENIEDVLTVSVGGKCSNYAVNRLKGYMKTENITQRQVPAILKDAVEKHRAATNTEITDGVFAEITASLLASAWSDFLLDTENEVAEAASFYESRRKFEKHIKLFSEDLCKKLITASVSRTMTVEIVKR